MHLERKWKNDHTGCAWCDKPAFFKEIEVETGLAVGACKTHKPELLKVTRKRASYMSADHEANDSRITLSLSARDTIAFKRDHKHARFPKKRS